MYNLYQFASANTEESVDLLGSLGIDIQTLVFQLIAFLILVFILSKWVYPVFVGIIERRETDIERSTQTADRLKAEAAESETKTAEILAKARKQASEIVSSARDEATATIEKAEKKAKNKSAALLAEADAEIELSKNNARQDLLKEASALVSSATKKVLGKMSNQEIDDALIDEALKEAR